MKRAILTLALCAIGLATKAQTVYKTQSGYYACVTERALEKATSYSVAKDYDALQSLLDTKTCFALKAGVTVYVEQYKFFKGIVEVRPKGYTASVWTNIEAIKD